MVRESRKLISLLTGTRAAMLTRGRYRCVAAEFYVGPSVSTGVDSAGRASSAPAASRTRVVNTARATSRGCATASRGGEACSATKVGLRGPGDGVGLRG